MTMPLDEKPKEVLAALERELAQRQAENRLAAYRPYAKQREFHAMAARERLLMAGNQLGKTLAGAFEMAMHLTGVYPPWWAGRRFERAVMAWAGSVTSLATRDTVQRLAVGRPGQHGTGAVPRKAIVATRSALGTPDLLDHVKVQHVDGGVSVLAFKSYEQGREKWQGETLDVVWFDEEPPADIYFEGLTRTNATGGMAYMTFTPLLGMSDVVKRFLLDRPPGTGVVTMTIDDAEHYTPEQRAAIIASYPPHEREARAKGIPTLGSGRIFPVPEDDIAVDAFDVPPHWAQIVGIDFGYDHPSAAGRLAWDRDADVLYLTHVHRARQQTPVLFAPAVKAWGSWLPVAWPHDGLQHDKGSGIELAAQYRQAGLNMLPERATFEDGSSGVEAGLMEMLDRMQTGRFKVFRHLEDWWQEFRLYHRKDGRVVKESDDLISAVRYAVMARRFAATKPSAPTFRRRGSPMAV
jgi:phage terminase large subunit-like protein